MNSTRPARPMFPHLFLDCSTVNSSEHNRQWRAVRAGVTTLAGYHAWIRNTQKGL